MAKNIVDPAGAASKGSYALVNGLNMYYEIHGSGEPLFLLPGGFMTVDAMRPLLPALAQTRKVIAVELQGHGHTGDSERPLRFEYMADDIAALIKQLGLESADVCGYSLGGEVALQTAIRHPEVVRKLVLISTAYQRAGWYPEVQAGMGSMNAEAMLASPMYETYISMGSKAEDWPTLVAKFSQLLVGEAYDWTNDVAALKMPVLIMVGDADSIYPAHAVEMFGLLGGGKADGATSGLPHSQLAILPGTTHFSIIANLDLLLPIISPFLEVSIPAVSR